MRKILLTTVLSLVAAFQMVGQVSDSSAVLGQFYNDTVARSVIVARSDLPSDISQPGFFTLSGDALGRKGSSLGTADLMMHIKRLPGVAAGGGFQPGFYVRGGTGDDNQVLMDGIPVFQTGHLGGLFSAFNMDALSSVSLYSGGMPARYGGRASSVLDIRTAEGDYDHFHGIFNIGLTDGRLHLDGPIMKESVALSVSMRRSWMDLVLLPLVNGQKGDEESDNLNLRFCFGDLNARISYRNGSSLISAMLYYGYDPLSFSYSSLSGTSQNIEMDDLKAQVNWTSLLYGLKLEKELPCMLHIEMLAYSSLCNGEVGVFSDSQEGGLHSINGVAEYGIKSAIMYDSSVDNRFRAGIDIALKQFSSGIDSKKDLLPQSQYACEYALYVDDEYHLDGNITLCPGVRAMAYGKGADIMGSVEPRFSMRWNATRRTIIKLSYAHAVQYLHKVATGMIDFPTYVWMPAASDVSPMKVSQFSAAATCYATDNMKLSAESFYKYMTGVYDYFGEQTIVADVDSWHRLCVEGLGRGYGLEFQASYSNGRLKADASYTLSWSERYFSKVSQEWFPDRQDNRHKFVLDMEYAFNERFKLTLSWMARSGGQWNYQNPDTGYLVGAKMPAYHRMDMGLDYVKVRTAHRERRWRLSIFNVYNACSPLIYTAVPEPDSEGGYKIEMSGNIPLLPTVSYTLKF